MNAYKLVGWHVVVHRQPTINLKEFCDPAREILLVLRMTNKVHYDFQYQYDSLSGSIKDEGTRNMHGIATGTVGIYAFVFSISPHAVNRFN